MTVETEVSEIDFAGTGGVTDFPVPFPIQAEEQLVVTLLLSGETVPTTQILGTHYSVSGVGDPTCQVTMLAAPAALSTLHVERTVDVIQPTSFRTQGQFTAKSHEDALDYRTYVDQQQQRDIEALQALATLLDISTLTAAKIDVSFTTDSRAIENSFDVNLTDGILPAGAMPVGFVPTMVIVGKVAGGAGGREAVMVRDWAADGTVLTIGFITGLELATEYTITLLLLSVT